MRAVLIAAAVAAVVVMPLTAQAAPAATARSEAKPPQHVITVDTRCGPGWHWVEAGYAKKGKWRDGRCVPD